MDRGLAQTVGLGLLTACLTVFVARVDTAPAREAGGTLAADSLGVRHDSAITIRWLNDANVIALVKTMNDRQIAAADLVLSAWHLDSVRVAATALIRQHTALQRSADSIAAVLQIAPVAPALTDSVRAAFQVHIDSMTSHVGYALDRAYLEQQVSTHALMTDYLTQLATVAQAPELRAWLESVKKQLAGQVTLVQAQQTALAVADSVRADSIAKRAEARKRRQAQQNAVPR
jgi:hypothetical protein